MLNDGPGSKSVSGVWIIQTMESETDCICKRPAGGCGGVASTAPSTTTGESKSVIIKHKNKNCSWHRFF